MKVELNLATRPLGRTRLFWSASAVIGLALVAAAASLVSYYVSNREPSPELTAAEASLSAELARLTADEGRMNALLRAPETIDVYDRSYFLNQLLTRKGVSWTRTFEDLEGVLPPRVLMMQIRPEVTADNTVRLDMLVGAETWADFIEFLEQIESSEVFGSPDLRGYAPPNENQPHYRFELTVNYDQQL